MLYAFKSSQNPQDQDTQGSVAKAIYTQFIYNACMLNCEAIGSDRFGCCVM